MADANASKIGEMKRSSPLCARRAGSSVEATEEAPSQEVTQQIAVLEKS